MIKLFRRKFECPICGYNGPFRTVKPKTGSRKYAQCPSCNALERHRLQYLVLENVLRERNVSEYNLLHFAPEIFMEKTLASRVGSYFKIDLNMNTVDCRADMCNLPFADCSFDIVYASHVLEHIKNDSIAISEIKRILTPGGIAILPLPIVNNRTIEYSEPNPYESNHVRAPGKDYFERYKAIFDHVEIFSSARFDEKFQLFVYEDRGAFPANKFPNRQRMEGCKHHDFVPVCYTKA